MMHENQERDIVNDEMSAEMSHFVKWVDSRVAKGDRL